ncbi:hypothetical protein [Gymnodinialimonas hymeniacidonis]|uniref:hypothetical protein n=1 Tax=Gymnodinialimonas hymeniacidonis TaxID=3126508 RepID=UPI0034C667A5
MKSRPSRPKDTVDPPTGRLDAPCIIVHSNVLVAEDLRDILMNAGAQDVVVYSDFAAIKEDVAALVIASGGLERTLRAERFDAWGRNGTPVVLLDVGQRSEDAAKFGLHVLEEPFRTEDVIELLTDLRIF